MTRQLAHIVVSPLLAIEPDWVDYNGHLNQAYYSVLFDRALDDALAPVGLGPEYIKTHNCSYMTVETHLCFVREVFLGDPLRVHSRILDVDDKRLHMFCELKHATEGWVSCTSEWMFLHIDMTARRTAPWPAEMRAKLESMKEGAARLGWPERAGRKIGIVRKG